MPPQFGGGPKCSVCGKSVYFNEEKRAVGKVFHIACFKCSSCKKTLDSTSTTEHEDNLYCKTCYGKNFGPRGYGFAGGAAGLNSGASRHGNTGAANGCNGVGGAPPVASPQDIDPSDPERCLTCGGRVYFAEQVLALGRKWHKLCFKCSTCKKSLDSTNSTEHDGMPYCKSCYGKAFGPAGYGFAGGAAGLSTAASQPTHAHSGVPTGGVVDRDDPECCPRCGKRVYFAEQVLSLGRKWHKLCFKCAGCNKTVDSTSAADHEGELFCKGCYGKNFGPKGVGYGVGAGSLHT